MTSLLYCEESSLNTLEWEKGSAIKISPNTTITPRVEPDAIPKESFLIMENWATITSSDLADSIINEADKDIISGNIKRFKSVDEMLASLKAKSK